MEILVMMRYLCEVEGRMVAEVFWVALHTLTHRLLSPKNIKSLKTEFLHNFI
jgi:hypothetical protein